MANINPSLILDSNVCEIRPSVDAETASYHVHGALLKSKARCFTDANTSYLTHTGSAVYHFVTDTKPEALRSFIAWLYTGKVYFGDDEAFEPEKIEPDVMDLEPDESWGETDGKRDKENSPDLEDVPFDEEADEEADEKACQIDEELTDSELPEPQGGNILEHWVWDVWRHTKPVDHDGYQIRVLRRLYETADNVPPEVKRKLQQTLQENEKIEPKAGFQAASKPPPLAYDRLIDLYILAHRFEAPELCNQIITLLQAEHDEQQAILGGRPLPSYKLVARAYNAVPKGSTLRDWLLNIYTCNWRSVSLSEETIAAMEELPKEFVTHLWLIRR